MEQQDTYSILLFILIAIFVCGIIVALVTSIGEAQMKKSLKTAQTRRQTRRQVPPPLAEVARSVSLLGPGLSSDGSRMCPRLGCHTLNHSAARFCRRCGNAMPPKMPSQA